MITALRKIEGHSTLSAPAQIQEMFLDHPRGRGLAGIFATHPSIDSRIAALVQYGGGRDPGPIPDPVPPPVAASPPATPAPWAADPVPDAPAPPAGPPAHGPWG
jgi:heat shock protein HtpX